MRCSLFTPEHAEHKNIINHTKLSLLERVYISVQNIDLYSLFDISFFFINANKDKGCYFLKHFSVIASCKAVGI